MGIHRKFISDWFIIMAEDSSVNNNDEVFIYTEGVEVPLDVVRVRVDSSVAVIPDDAFGWCHQLKEVDLCEGLLEIGKHAFKECTSLKKITIPSFKEVHLEGV